jgi:[ribosomal protein S5]-alanine N-acetyltransferase
MAYGWPVTITEGSIELRPLRHRDEGAWHDLRARNVGWLQRWEATAPDGSGAPMRFSQLVRHYRAEGRAGRMLPWVITVDEQLVGQLTVGSIQWGSLRCAQMGYWIGQEYAGRGIVPTGVAMATDYCLSTLGLHRIEVNIRPENVASLRVVEKLGFRDEGLRLKYLHIDGAWRDHRAFALTREDLTTSLMSRWRASRHHLA